MEPEGVCGLCTLLAVQMDMTAAAYSRHNGLNSNGYAQSFQADKVGSSRTRLSEPSSLAGRRVRNSATVRGRPAIL